MILTQGAFSYLPPLTDDEIRAQIRAAMGRGFTIALEYSDDPHPRNVYWEMFGMPMFDAAGVEEIMTDLARCRESFPQHYIRLCAFDPSLGRQTIALSFIVHRPAVEPGFRLARAEGPGRRMAYSLVAYATDAPPGQRYRV